MKKILLMLCLGAGSAYAQAPFPHISSSAFSAERVASFGLQETPDDFLEITNSTQFDGSFIPSIWGHQQSDERFVLRLFATTTSAFDTGEIPIMVFRSELRNAINHMAPTGSAFPWGTDAAPVANRPVFAWENGSTQLMTMRANGYLGLGTITPTALFHTYGSVRFENLANASNPAFMLGTDSDGNVFEYPVPTGGTGGSADADFLKPDGSVPVDINDNMYTNGFTGFNVQNPTSVIHANGAVTLENLANATNPAFMLGTDANGNVFEYPVPTSGAGSSADADWLKPDGGLAMDINDNIYTNGKVGINTSIFPTQVGTEDVSFYNLFVIGGILTEEVRVAEVDDWADYVFKPGYKLPTLQEVEQHIKDKGHLINIPSEAEVKQNGVELAEMNKLLLEKVEELTLYTIEMNKKMEQMQQEIEALKKQSKK